MPTFKLNVTKIEQITIQFFLGLILQSLTFLGSGRGGLEVEQWIDNSLLSISADRIHLSDSINRSVVEILCRYSHSRAPAKGYDCYSRVVKKLQLQGNDSGWCSALFCT